MTRPASKRVAQALLGTFFQDEVPPESKERAFAAFGIATGVTGISTVATGGSSGAAVIAAAPAGAIVAKTAATVGVFSVLKAGIVGVVMGVIAVHAADQVVAHPGDAASASHRAATQQDRHDLEAANPAPSAAPPFILAPHPGEPVEIDPAAAALESAMPPLSAPASSSRARTPAAGHIGSTPSTANGALLALGADEKPAAGPNAAPAASAALSAPATLTGEIARLDRSRAALREGTLARALRELDGYDAEFAKGSLRQEADVLRIEVLVDMGESGRARALANAFAHAHPTSGYLSKIRELLARGPKRTAP